MEMTTNMRPPDSVQGMKVLDRSAFEKTVNVPGFYVPLLRMKLCTTRFKKELLRVPGIKPIAELAESDERKKTHKLFLLNPDIVDNVTQFIKDEEDFFRTNNIDIYSIKTYHINMGYRNWTHQEVLKAVLPDESDGVAGFSTIGHIIHVNLREEVSDHKHLIGEVLLDKVPSAKTVVNKLNVIDSTYRNFKMELLAGEDNMVTTTREHGCVFELDFSKVYWNPRLSTEHQRIVADIARKDVVYDVFAGIGPFAVPAAKKGCSVHANDLNPESYKWLQHNLKLNKVKSEHCTYNMDGRDFIKTIMKMDLLSRLEKNEDTFPRIHVIMNLPALAIDFLDAFKGLLDGSEIRQDSYFVSPIIYCYCFSKGDDKHDIIHQVEKRVDSDLPSDASVRFVRNVAPNKDMHCVIFSLPKEVLYGKEVTAPGVNTECMPPPTKNDCMPPPTKRQKDEDL